MDFLHIETLGTTFKYVVKIEEKFEQKGKKDYFLNNKSKGEGGSKFGGKQTTKDLSSHTSSTTNKGNKKMCEFHKTPGHNTKDY